jgi:hypothetical protein
MRLQHFLPLVLATSWVASANPITYAVTVNTSSISGTAEACSSFTHVAAYHEVPPYAVMVSSLPRSQLYEVRRKQVAGRANHQPIERRSGCDW